MKYRLIDRAVDMAMSGNTTMMIFCLKNYCGWVEKAESPEDDVKPFTLAYSIEDLKLTYEK